MLATSFASWADSAHDDLEEEFAPESVEEVAALEATHVAFLATFKGIEAQREQIQTLHTTIASKNLGTNPYTPLTMDGLNESWTQVQALAKVRSGESPGLCRCPPRPSLTARTPRRTVHWRRSLLRDPSPCPLSCHRPARSS